MIEYISFSHYLKDSVKVFIEASVIGGVCILIGILIASRKAALLAVIASLLNFIIVALLGGIMMILIRGLFGYKLCINGEIALGYTFKTAINPYISTF